MCFYVLELDWGRVRGKDFSAEHLVQPGFNPHTIVHSRSSSFQSMYSPGSTTLIFVPTMTFQVLLHRVNFHVCFLFKEYKLIIKVAVIQGHLALAGSVSRVHDAWGCKFKPHVACKRLLKKNKVAVIKYIQMLGLTR